MHGTIHVNTTKSNDMKTIRNKDSFNVLGVKFENIQEAILFAIKRLAKNGIYVGEDAKRYPCFDSED